MKNLFIKILAFLILSSFTAETAMLVFTNDTEMVATQEKEDNREKPEEEKTEKESEKDKINFASRQRFISALNLKHIGKLQLIFTSAYLSLPEIPPDRA